MNIVDFYKNKQDSEILIYQMYNNSVIQKSFVFDGDKLTGLINGDLIDSGNAYSFNKMEYRSPEFTSNPDIIFAGCSFTFGLGVSDENIWPNLVAEDKYTFANLSQVGISTEKIVSSCINHIDIYGKPKKIFCLFPDFLRNNFVNDPDFHVYDRPMNEIAYEHSWSQTVSWPSMDMIKPNKYVKMPFDINKNISPHYFIYKYINSIYILQTLCKALDIDFVWSIWHKDTAEIIESLFNNNNFYLNKDNYISLIDAEKKDIAYGSNESLNQKCSEDHDHRLKDSLGWETGTDVQNHPGIHWHYHISNLFKSSLS